jgi:hypothetical protein
MARPTTLMAPTQQATSPPPNSKPNRPSSVSPDDDRTNSSMGDGLLQYIGDFDGSLKSLRAALASTLLWEGKHQGKD